MEEDTRARCAPAQRERVRATPYRTQGDRGPKRDVYDRIGTWLPLAQTETGGGRPKSTGTRCQPNPRTAAGAGLALHCFTRISWLWPVGTSTTPRNVARQPQRRTQSNRADFFARGRRRRRRRTNENPPACGRDQVALSRRLELERSFGLVGQQQQDRFRFDLPAGGCVYLLRSTSRGD